MSASARTASAVVIFLALVSFRAEARDLTQRVTTVYTCDHPPSGIWKFEHYLPTGDGGHVLGIRTYLVMEEEFPGIYAGSGGGVVLIDGAVPAGTPVSYTFLAVFQNTTCTMSGTIINFEGQAVDSFAWEYNGKKLMGITANYVGGNVTTPYPGRHELTHLD